MVLSISDRRYGLKLPIDAAASGTAVSETALAASQRNLFIVFPQSQARRAIGGEKAGAAKGCECATSYCAAGREEPSFEAIGCGPLPVRYLSNQAMIAAALAADWL